MGYLSNEPGNANSLTFVSHDSTLSGDGTPISPLQVGSPNLDMGTNDLYANTVYGTNNSSVVYTVNDPTGGNLNQTYPGFYSLVAIGNYWEFDVFAGRHTPDGDIFSVYPIVISGYDNPSGINPFCWQLDWDPGDADFYRILIANDDINGYYGDHYVDTPDSTPTLIYDGVSGVVYGNTITPKTPYTYYNGIAGQFRGRVIIDPAGTMVDSGKLFEANGDGHFWGNLYLDKNGGGFDDGNPLLIKTTNAGMELLTTGDVYGEMSAKLLNRDGYGGLFIEQNSISGAGGVVDIGLTVALDGVGVRTTNSVRFETRSSYIHYGNHQEFQFGPPGSPYFVAGNKNVYTILPLLANSFSTLGGIPVLLADGSQVGASSQQQVFTAGLSVGTAGAKTFNVITSTTAEMVHYENTNPGQPTTFEFYADNGIGGGAGSVRGYFGLIPGTWQGITGNPMVFQGTGPVVIASGLNVPQVIVRSTGATFVNQAVFSGGLVGGSGVTDALTLKGTTGNGTSTAIAINMNVGNNGATSGMYVFNDGHVTIGTNTHSAYGLYVANGSFYCSSSIYAGNNSTIGFGKSKITESGTGQMNFYSGATPTLAMVINATQQIVIGGTTPATTALLDLQSTTQGFLPPRMTTTQRTAISSPAEGLIVYDLTTHKSYTYDGTTWQAHY